LLLIIKNKNFSTQKKFLMGATMLQKGEKKERSKGVREEKKE
jgi:hypothetical protein